MTRLSGLLHARSLVLLALAGALVALGASAGAGQQISQETLMNKLHWRNVGPYIGGRVVTVTGVPSQQNLFYMGTVGGGVWKSTDYGVSWQNITDGQLKGPSANIGAIAVADSNPKILYAGTGESDIRGTMITGDGVYKSTDDGKTWHYVGLRDTHTTSNIVVDPKNPDVVYASSMGHVFVPNPDRGVFKSTDGGKTWNKILFVDDKTGAINLVMDPSNPDVLYAAMWQAYRTPYSLSSGGPGSGLYKTTDGGAHWTNISHSEGFAKDLLGRIGVSVSASNPNIVYAIVQAKDGGVFRSEDGGKSWKRVNEEWKLRQRAFYYMTIYVDPKDPNTVYAPEVDDLFVSRDGGKTWKKLHAPHGDHHVLWINPNNTNILLEGNDGGATVSTNGGKTWSTVLNQPTGQFYHVNLDDQFPYHIYGAQQDEGSFEGPSATSQGGIPLAAWHSVAYGESTFVVPQPGNPKDTYGSGYYSLLLKYDMATEQFESVSPWPNYQSGAASEALKYRFAWTHPILFSPVNPKVLLVGSQYVLRSDDYGRTWREISPDLTRNDPSTQKPSGGPIDLDHSGAEVFPCLSALAVSPLNGDLIWAGSDDGLVHVTTDGGKQWKAVRPPDLPKWAEISSIEPSHAAEGTAYLSAQRYMWNDFHPYLYKTTDYGQHWTSIIAGLPAGQYVYTVRQDPHDANLLFATTRSTVYVSFDGGAGWQPLTLNLPTAQVRDLRIDSRQGQVVVATHGRAFWVLDNLAFLEQMTKSPAVETNGAYLFAPEKAWLTQSYGVSTEPRVPTSTDGENPPFGATVFFHIPANYDGKTPAKLEFTDSSGQLIRSFTLHLKKKEAKEKEEETDESQKTTVQLIQEQEEKLTGIEPGMNSFQWNLRYPYATEVTGFHAPVAAGGLDNTTQGPQVVPGTYSVVLDYGGQKTRQSFEVGLDPRIHIAPDALAHRLALELQIHTALNSLNGTLNRAIALRDKLEAAVRSHKLSEAQAGSAISGLDREIAEMVQLGMRSSEGDLLHTVRIRSHLAYLAADIGLAYKDPTPAQQAVFEHLAQEAKAGEQKLEAEITAASKLL
jgi:photosystem II stability/assembly factor-like uncharacterized protein